MTARRLLTLVEDNPPTRQPKPFFVAAEGPPGVGKTALVRRLSRFLYAPAFLDPVPDNRLLANLHAGTPTLDPRRRALRTELIIVGLRVPELRAIRDHLDGGRCVLTDWTMCRSEAYAASTLDASDQDRLADTVDLWTAGLPKPDLVLLLQAGAATLAARIRRRGRPAEVNLRPADLAARSGALTRMLAGWGPPVLTVNTATLQLDDDAAVQGLADRAKAALEPATDAPSPAGRRSRTGQT